jgi:hypothetical protein
MPGSEAQPAAAAGTYRFWRYTDAQPAYDALLKLNTINSQYSAAKDTAELSNADDDKIKSSSPATWRQKTVDGVSGCVALMRRYDRRVCCTISTYKEI